MIGTVVTPDGMVHGVVKLSAVTQSPISVCGSGFTGASLEPVAAVTCLWCLTRKLRPLAAIHPGRTYG